MDLAQLARYRLDWICSFVAVARHGGFSAAAEALYRSQPRISMHVVELERVLGVRLFDRSTHPAVLTPEGRAVLPRAIAVLEQVQALSDGVGTASGDIHGEVRLAIYPSASAFLLPELFAHLGAAHPGVRLTLREGATRELGGLLRCGEAELAVRPRQPPVDDERLASSVLWREPLVAVVPMGHPLAGEREVALGDLAGLPLITIGEGEDRTSSQFETTLAFDQAALTPRVAFRSNQPQTLVALVRGGLGTGVTNALAMTTSNLDGVCLVPISDIACQREVAVWWRTDEHTSPATAAVREVIAALPPPSGIGTPAAEGRRGSPDAHEIPGTHD